MKDILSTRETIIELLGQFGESREAREYLRRFSSVDELQFAVVKVGGEVIRSSLDQLATALSFLHQVGLFPIVLHGAGPQLAEALTAAGIQSSTENGLRVTTPEVMTVVRPVIYEQNTRLVDALESRHVRARPLQHGVFDCELMDHERLGLVGHVQNVRLDLIRSAIQAGALPIVSCLGESPSGQVMNVNADHAARALVSAIRPYKVIFISDTGGLLNQNNEIISAINLETDYEWLKSQSWLHSGMRLKIEEIKRLLDELPRTTSVSITSAEHLARELFTHRGAGTLIRRGESMIQSDALDESDRHQLIELIHECFGYRMASSYFDALQLDRVIWPESRRAAAVITCQADQPILYLDKFAVTPAGQGEGLGSALWHQVREIYPHLYWRSRIRNPINTWYFRQSDFAYRGDEWAVFGIGMDAEAFAGCCASALQKPDHRALESANG